MGAAPCARQGPVTGSPSVGHRHAPEARAATMPRRRSRRRGVDYDLKERLTGRTLQYLDVDYLASTGSLISCSNYITQTKRKTAQKLWRNPHELVCLGSTKPASPRTFHGFSHNHRSTKNAHSLLHELRCFFDAPYRLHQVRMATKAQMRTLGSGCVQLFEKYDLDRSGCIDRDELGKAIRDSLHLNIRSSEVDVIWRDRQGWRRRC